MSLLVSIIIALILIGLILWLIDFLPLDPTIKRIIHGVAIVAVILWLLFQLLPLVHGAPIRLR